MKRHSCSACFCKLLFFSIIILLIHRHGVATPIVSQGPEYNVGHWVIQIPGGHYGLGEIDASELELIPKGAEVLNSEGEIERLLFYAVVDYADPDSGVYAHIVEEDGSTSTKRVYNHNALFTQLSNQGYGDTLNMRGFKIEYTENGELVLAVAVDTFESRAYQTIRLYVYEDGDFYEFAEIIEDRIPVGAAPSPDCSSSLVNRDRLMTPRYMQICRNPSISDDAITVFIAGMIPSVENSVCIWTENLFAIDTSTANRYNKEVIDIIDTVDRLRLVPTGNAISSYYPPEDDYWDVVYDYTIDSPRLFYNRGSLGNSTLFSSYFASGNWNTFTIDSGWMIGLLAATDRDGNSILVTPHRSDPSLAVHRQFTSTTGYTQSTFSLGDSQPFSLDVEMFRSGSLEYLDSGRPVLLVKTSSAITAITPLSLIPNQPAAEGSEKQHSLVTVFPLTFDLARLPGVTHSSGPLNHFLQGWTYPFPKVYSIYNPDTGAVSFTVTGINHSNGNTYAFYNRVVPPPSSNTYTHSQSPLSFSVGGVERFDGGMPTEQGGVYKMTLDTDLDLPTVSNLDAYTVLFRLGDENWAPDYFDFRSVPFINMLSFPRRYPSTAQLEYYFTSHPSVVQQQALLEVYGVGDLTATDWKIIRVRDFEIQSNVLDHDFTISNHSWSSLTGGTYETSSAVNHWSLTADESVASPYFDQIGGLFRVSVNYRLSSLTSGSALNAPSIFVWAKNEFQSFSDFNYLSGEGFPAASPFGGPTGARHWHTFYVNCLADLDNNFEILHAADAANGTDWILEIYRVRVDKVRIN